MKTKNGTVIDLLQNLKISESVDDKQEEKDDIKRDLCYIEMALMTAQRSKDPCTQVGCVIVDDDDHIVSMGYNGFPIGIDDDQFRWDKVDPTDNKHLYVVHAEMNAIINKRRNNLKNCTAYVTLFPCNECSKMLIQSRISRVVYMDDRDAVIYKASRKMFDSVPVTLQRIELPNEKIVVKI